MIVRKLVYRCGALVLYQRECDDLKMMQKWIWGMAMRSRKGIEMS